MKGVSLKNPFANLIAMGYKSIETRTATSAVAKTKHRGTVLICTSGSPHEQWEWIKQHYLFSMEYIPLDPFLKIATDKLWEECNHEWQRFSEKLMLPMMDPSIVAIANLYTVRDMKAENQEAACFSLFPYAKAMALTDVKRVKPVPIKGLTNGFHLGVFDVHIDRSELTIL
jgi:hypothetical protein